jgi:hypothetical protein
MIVGALLGIVALAGVAFGIYGMTRGGADNATLSNQAAKAAIQEYLDALAKSDADTIARHTSCGLYDAVKERKSDLALAALAAQAFHDQFSKAEVTSIDKIVRWSSNQAQVLFTMRVAPSRITSRGQPPPDEEQQAVAQLLIQDKTVLVCSYLIRTGAQY